MSGARARMRYVIRARSGRELVCPSLADLHALYAQGFVGEDDLVRAETSEQWVRAGAMPALRGVRERRRDPRKALILLVAAAAIVLALFLLVAGCGGASARSSQQLQPDVPSWRGGCFLAGPDGKIVNATAAPEIVSFGQACANGSGAGGLVYLDRFDPASGDGDVTVLSAAPGAAPVVVAPHGGGGAIQIGSTGARIDGTGSRLLTLARVSFVTGDLVEARLPDGRARRTVGTGVRVGNYDFVGGGGVVYVGNYDATQRQGDVFYADDRSASVIGPSASRFDFLMYRLAPDRTRVAWLRGWTEDAGGDLLVQSLPPSGDAVTVAQRAFGMAWTDDGHLAFRTVNPDGVTYDLWSWDGVAAPVRLAPAVQSASVLGDDVIYTTDWSVLEQRALLHMIPIMGGPDFLGGTGPASLSFAASRPAGSGGVLAWFAVPAVTVANEGDLQVTALTSFAPRTIDTGVSVDAGIGVSPDAAHLSYAVGFEGPQTPGSANPQPGVARELRVGSVPAGSAFVLARSASTFVAWDPRARFVAALEAFSPATNAGDLTVRALDGGAQVLTVAGVGNARFGFADDGSFLWALRSWDDALGVGELVTVSLDGGTLQPATLSLDVAWAGPATGGRLVYGVRDGVRDGLWLGSALRSP